MSIGKEEVVLLNYNKNNWNILDTWSSLHTDADIRDISYLVRGADGTYITKWRTKCGSGCLPHGILDIVVVKCDKETKDGEEHDGVGRQRQPTGAPLDLEKKRMKN
jgi:hypothetical protein